VFRNGFPVRRIPNGLEMKKADTPFLWPPWRQDVPQWRLNDRTAYVEDGFNLNSLIYSALMYKARSKMSAPLRAYTGDPARPERLPPDHPLTQLVARPNPHQGWAEFQMRCEIFFNLGDCFIALIRPKGGGLATAMYNLRTDWTYIIPSSEGGIKGYLYVPEQKAIIDGVPFLAEDILHVKLPNPADPLEGLGYGMPPSAIGQSADVDNDVTRFLKLFFQAGAMPTGLLTSDQFLNDEDITFIRERWKDIYGGVDNWIEPAVLGKGMKYQRVTATAEEMGFQAIDERNETRILGPLGVPPILIGARAGLMRSTYSNYEQARRAYWEDTALPELMLFEPEFQYHLQTDDGGFVAYDLAKVPALQKDTPRLVAAAFKMWQMGTPANMAYEAVGLGVPEVPGGDIGYVTANLVPVGVDVDTDDQSMEGAAEAEEDERDKALPNPWLTKQEPDDPDIDQQVGDYQRDIDALVQQAINGEIEQEEFERRMRELVTAMLLIFFLLGAGLENEADLSRADRTELDEQLEINLESVGKFSTDIYAGTYAVEGGQENATSRVALWAAAALGIYALGQQIRRDNPKLMWVFDPSKEHCTDCLRLHKQVHTASEWRKSGWKPQSSGLECGGWHCGCRWVEVAESTPVSGRFSRPLVVTEKQSISSNGKLGREKIK
jgi:HK97 family phage portal protein